jgi:SAM-dependent methyltransferase
MYWCAHPVIHDHFQKRATNGSSQHWVNSIVDSYASNNNCRVLSMGCGEGALERHISSLRHDAVIDAVDLSETSIAMAVASANSLSHGQIKYYCDDFERFLRSRSGQCKYDLVIYNMSLHHAQDPFHLLELSKQHLNQTGYLVLNEYVGPARLQLKVELKSFIQRCLDSFPLGEGTRLGIYEYPSIAQVISADASEAINPAIINYAVNELFACVDTRNIATSFLVNIAEHFSALSDADARYLCHLDETLMSIGFFDADYRLIIACDS